MLLGCQFVVCIDGTTADIHLKTSLLNRNRPSSIFSPEVIRTRLREEGSKYRSFFQTLSMVVREEGYRALYRGLTTHLVRQIPNTAIMMCTYELVVYLLNG